jgi:hypothetical protein
MCCSSFAGESPRPKYNETGLLRDSTILLFYPSGGENATFAHCGGGIFAVEKKARRKAKIFLAFPLPVWYSSMA